MSMEFSQQHTPISEALGSSFRDLGGSGQEPFNLKAGLAVNGLSPSADPAPQMQDKGFDVVLKAPKIDPPALKAASIAPRKPGG